MTSEVNGWSAAGTEEGAMVFRNGADTATVRIRHTARDTTRVVVGLNRDSE